MQITTYIEKLMESVGETVKTRKSKVIFRVLIYTQGKAGFYDHLKKEYGKDFTDVEKARKYAKSWANSGTSPLIKKNTDGGDIWTDVKF